MSRFEDTLDNVIRTADESIKVLQSKIEIGEAAARIFVQNDMTDNPHFRDLINQIEVCKDTLAVVTMNREAVLRRYNLPQDGFGID